MKRKEKKNKECFCFFLVFLVFSTFKILEKEVCFLFLFLFFLEDFISLLLLIQEEEF